MSGIQWAYPRTVGEAIGTFAGNPSAKFHGGGTGLLRSATREGLLVDLSKCGLGEINAEGSNLVVGATATMGALLERIAAMDEAHILVPVLRETATPALRNRITVGGSVAMFPPWSGLVGSLVALDAEVELAGGVAADSGAKPRTAAGSEDRRQVPIAEYLTGGADRRGTLVTAIRFPIHDDARYGWYRFVRMNFDYASFSLAVALRGGGPDEAVTEARVVIVGTQNRFDRLYGVEERLCAGAPSSVSIADLASGMPTRNGYSGEYLTEVAIVQLQRILNEMRGGAK